MNKAQAVVKPKPRKPPVKVSDREIMNAIEATQGDYKKAAKKLAISYPTLLNRAKKNPEIYQVKLDCLGDWIQIAEMNVYERLLKGDFAASKFVLERLSRDKWGNQPAQASQEAWPEPIGNDPNGP